LGIIAALGKIPGLPGWALPIVRMLLESLKIGISNYQGWEEIGIITLQTFVWRFDLEVNE
jgi:hypothetical protein